MADHVVEERSVLEQRRVVWKRRDADLSIGEHQSTDQVVPDEAFDRSIDVHVSRLRQKLGDDPRKPRFIKTVRGAGYQFIARPDAA